MCIICVSDKGIKQPTKATMQEMWNSNPHGAGFMYYRDGMVHIKKGYMKFEDFWKAVQSMQFTKDDVVVYHFRISTQGGVNPEMTQPFFFTNDLVKTKTLETDTKLGICHNGIIPMTSNGDKEYSDTARFVAEYLPRMVRRTSDLDNPYTQELLAEVLNSKMVFLDLRGTVTLIGNFVYEKDGLIYSNTTYKPRTENYKHGYRYYDSYLEMLGKEYDYD